MILYELLNRVSLVQRSVLQNVFMFLISVVLLLSPRGRWPQVSLITGTWGGGSIDIWWWMGAKNAATPCCNAQDSPLPPGRSHPAPAVVLVQSLSNIRLFSTSWTVARQASLSFIVSQSVLKRTSLESVMLPNHLILCGPLFLLPSIFPSIRVFSKQSQSIGASASASVFLMNNQGWSVRNVEIEKPYFIWFCPEAN